MDRAQCKAANEKHFSEWDGSNPALTELIKKNMNDPDSYEHIESKFRDDGDKIFVITRFRGKKCIWSFNHSKCECIRRLLEKCVANNRIEIQMKLNDFFKNTLLDIVKGVEEANLDGDRFRFTSPIHANGESGQKVEVDVNIIVYESNENEISGGQKVAILNLNGGINENETNLNTHKTKF